ncbi:TIGR03618 family F420-dependent PPOX class oxidoreductase [Spirillospora sp. NPDC047279]|uniref:pyridoxamine 5'-phosphate oxidase family protein n=1 Tax=Spirillospora sp. NPDC047279 TaxID=3155478 RepID=UPI0033C57942
MTSDTNENSGPAPRVLTDRELVDLLAGQRFGALAAVKKDGHPHLSTVLYEWDPEERTVRISSTEDRLKVRQLRNDPRTALHVNGGNVWSFAVAEGDAEIVPAPEAGPGRVWITIKVSRLYGTALDVADAADEG